jgi:septum site-determining protein MinD
MPAKTIAIFSTKGGVGKTFFAVNLAVALTKAGKKCCLVDLDLHAAQDMARMINLAPKHTILDLIPKLAHPEAEFEISKCMNRHSCGLDFIPAISQIRHSPHIKPETIETFLLTAGKYYDYIIVDGGKAFSDILIALLNQSNLIIYIATPDVLSVYQTKWGLDVLQSLHFPLKMVGVVLNRAESRGAVSWQEVKLALPCELLGMIPSEGKSVGLSLNKGNPVVLEAPHSKVSEAIISVANKLIEHPAFFIEHQELSQLRTKLDADLPRSGDFWERLGMVETLDQIAQEGGVEEDDVVKLKKRIHLRLVEDMSLKQVDINVIRNNPAKAKEFRSKASQLITNLLAEESGVLLSSMEVRKELVREILDEAFGLGPLEDLIKDPEITDIMVNNKDEVYIERGGKLELTSKKFVSNAQVRAIIERIISPLGRHIDESVPMVDARLPDGSRVNAIIPPLALTGPMLTIRKFSRERYSVEDLMRFGSLSQGMAQFLRASVIGRKNIVVSGGTGSGKTTLLNVLSSFIPDNERIITIEDAAELKLDQRHWGRLEARPSNIEGKGAITIRDLFRNCLRMRPDRIVIGECRGIETLDMLQAMNTGHDGSLTTIHANSTYDVLSRIDSMILMSGVELPVRAIREMIASAIDLIVHMSRLSDGSRKIVQITEISGMKDETHINLEDIFTFEQTGTEAGKIIGEFLPTGYTPSFYDELRVRGIDLPKTIFQMRPKLTERK